MEDIAEPEGDEKEKRWIQLDAPDQTKKPAAGQPIDSAVKEYVTPAEGLYTKGHYVRVDVMVENKYLGQFTPEFPVLACGFDQQEGTLTYMRTRFKKHRWYPKILKTFDPLIVSVGWRRFQTIFTYVVEDLNERRRLIKYTPKFDFCQGVFYGPSFAKGTAFLGIQTLAEDVAHFRIAATGDVLELAQTFPVMKKLKLVGEPMKIFKNTAFVKGMFNSKVRTCAS